MSKKIHYLKHLNIIFFLLSLLWSKDWKIRAQFFISLFLVVVTIALNLNVPIVLKKILEMLSNPPSTLNHLFFLVLMSYGIVWTLSRISSQFRQIVMYRVFERAIRLLSAKIFVHLNKLSLKFHLERKTGAVTNAIERAQFSVPNIIWSLFFVLVPTITEIILATTLLWYFYGIAYGVILASILSAFIIYSVLCTQWAVHAQRLGNEKNQQANSYLVDNFLNFETVKYFSNQQSDLRNYDSLLKEREDALTTQLIRGDLVGVGQAIIIGLGFILLTGLAGNQLSKGILQVGDFVLINSYLLQFVTPLSTFGFIFRQIRQGLTDMENVLDLLETKPDINDDPAALSLSNKSYQIAFQNVCFEYEENNPSLQDVSFNVPSGKTLAIVGPTGSGKSTIARLLMRLYDVKSGSILIDGHDIRKLSQNFLRNIIGVVPQETVLFNNSLYYNIAYGCPSASRHEIENAAKLAHLDFSAFPQGLDTKVGERGLKLSGGEKQRVGIARVLLKKPAILIFDEATSALDSETEKLIQKNLQQISSNCTTLIVAHRLSTIIHAHEIVVLDQGCIVERGTHKFLLEQKGLYEKLWNKQFVSTSQETERCELI